MLVIAIVALFFIGVKYLSWHHLVVIVSSNVVLWVYLFYTNILWKRLGVRYKTPLPLVGNDLELALGLKTFQDVQMDKYKYFGRDSYGGVYAMAAPALFVKDPKLIETILTTDFSHFTDRGLPFHEKKDPLSAHLFNLPGKRWKGLRSKLSPVFTSGKLKTMHQQLIDCADTLIEVLRLSAKIDEPIDFKELMSKFTTDVIGTCAYGLNMNSLQDPDNQFRVMGRAIFKTSLKRRINGVLRVFFRSFYPQLNYLLGIKSFPTEVTDFFTKTILETVKLRENNPQYNRNDFIQLIMNLRKQDDTTKQNGISTDNKDEEQVYVNDNLLAANSFLFFVAGFETTASTLSYCLFELAQNPEIQEKLYEEVKQVLSQHEGQPTYEAIKQLHYMESVISETLRKYPPVPFLVRVCTEAYRIPGTDIVLPKGTKVEIPTYSLHHDPNIYPDPEAFQPDRFSQQNKDTVPKGAFLPFGDGPRICIGARFAQMEIKVCLSKILSEFKIMRDPSTPDYIEFDPKSSGILIPMGIIQMSVSPR